MLCAELAQRLLRLAAEPTWHHSHPAVREGVRRALHSLLVQALAEYAALPADSGKEYNKNI